MECQARAVATSIRHALIAPLKMMKMLISEVHNMDNIEFMKGYADSFFDLAIIDPQTGQGEDKKHATRPIVIRQKNGTYLPNLTKHRIKDWDKSAPTQEFYDELFRVTKHQIIMCENYLYFDQKKTSAGRIIWNLCRQNDFSACQIMWTSLTNKIQYFEFLWNGMIQGFQINNRKQQGNKKLNEKRIHPNQKPVPVYAELLKMHAKPGFKILDTHVGSGSLRIACNEMGFDFYGCEKDEDIFNDHGERMKKYLADKASQLQLTA